MKFSAARKGFTTIEILVIVAVIIMLAGLLFPAFGRFRERSRQGNCLTNLHQIGLAVTEYYQDLKGYPPNLAALLPNDALLSKGYFRGDSADLVCPDDTRKWTLPHSSYGDLSLHPSKSRPNLEDPQADLSRYAWNYWGYDSRGNAGVSGDERSDYSKINDATELAYRAAFAGSQKSCPLWPCITPSKINASMLPRLANRFATPDTIVTHCAYHRPFTATNVDFPNEIYGSSPERRQGARDMILYLDGSVRSEDVSAWAAETPSVWQAIKH